MSDFSYGDILAKCIEELRAMVDSNTIIGTPIKTDDGITIIPVSRISFGVVSGGGEVGRKDKEKAANPALGLGSGMNIAPVAFLVVSNANVRIIPIGQPATTTVDRVIDLVPDVIDRVTAAFKKEKKGEESSAGQTEFSLDIDESFEA
jgi:sporulation protein YtfJ